MIRCCNIISVYEDNGLGKEIYFGLTRLVVRKGVKFTGGILRELSRTLDNSV